MKAKLDKKDLTATINRWLSGEVLDIGIVGKHAEENEDMRYILQSMQDRVRSMRVMLERINDVL